MGCCAEAQAREEREAKTGPYDPANHKRLAVEALQRLRGVSALIAADYSHVNPNRLQTLITSMSDLRSADDWQPPAAYGGGSRCWNNESANSISPYTPVCPESDMS